MAGSRVLHASCDECVLPLIRVYAYADSDRCGIHNSVVVLVSKNTSANLGVSNQLLTVLGLVLGLVISFRTSSAYERYVDRRRPFS